MISRKHSVRLQRRDRFSFLFHLDGVVAAGPVPRRVPPQAGRVKVVQLPEERPEAVREAHGGRRPHAVPLADPRRGVPRSLEVRRQAREPRRLGLRRGVWAVPKEELRLAHVL